jgi:hypothetical protein
VSLRMCRAQQPHHGNAETSGHSHLASVPSKARFPAGLIDTIVMGRTWLLVSRLASQPILLHEIPYSAHFSR